MLLEVKNIKMTLESSEILKDISFEIKRGEIIALLGPNGSGKTTLLRAIYGILKPEAGIAYFDGRKISEMSVEEIAKYIGYLPQEKAETGLRVIDVVLLGRTAYGRAPSEFDIEVARESLKEVAIENFEERPFSQLSGGEKQKVMLARIFAQKPELLLLDEPTAHLDISSQIEIMEILRKRTEKGSSSLIAIHDINLASTFCDRIIMVKNGKISHAGEPEIITPESIKEVFQADIIVKMQRGRPFVVPCYNPPISKNEWKVHVICGGGSGEKLFNELRKEGYSISAGVLNALDSDIEFLAGSGEIVIEAPFSPVSEESHEKNLKLIERSDAVILTDLCIGSGNLINLKAALKATELGKLIVIDSTQFSKRNFAGEKADKLYKKILMGSITVKNEKEALKALKGMLSA